MEKHAIFIANSEFTPESNLPKLETPLKDIESLAHVLSDESRNKFKPPLLLKNESADEICKQITKYFTKISANDLLVLFYSGHGLIDSRNRLSLATRDTNHINPQAQIKFQTINEFITNKNFKRVLIILDCCFSGAAGETFEPKGSNSIFDCIKIDNNFIDITSKARKASVLESKSGIETGSGIYLMTASAASEQAYGDLKEGLGVFTNQLIEGLKGGAIKEVDNNENILRIITTNSLFSFISSKMQEGGAIQTPKLFSRDVESAEMHIVEILKLSGDHNISDFSVWKEGGIFSGLTPAYILDKDYRFLHWNAAFQCLVASPLNLVRGAHVQTFLEKLDNWKNRVACHSITKFPPESNSISYPRLDRETLEFNSDNTELNCGLIVFEKIASRLRDGSQNWCVLLNITYAQQHERIWDLIVNAIMREDGWSLYASAYDDIIGEFDQYSKLTDLIVDSIGDVKTCLDIGSGTGNAAIKLLKKLPKIEISAIEVNYEMLCKFYSKIEGNESFKKRTKFLHNDSITALKTIKENSFDACIMVNVIFALDNPVYTLKEIYRVLKPGGILSISTSHDKTDIESLFKEIKKYFSIKGNWDSKKDLYEKALYENRRMVEIIQRYSEEDTVSFLKEAGFKNNDIVITNRGMYVGCVFTLEAKKK